MNKRVVVTGLGIVSCLGNNVRDFWNNLVNGVCGIDYITEFPTEALPVRIGGKVRNFDPLEYGMDKPFVRKQDPFAVYAMAAAWQAMSESGLTAGENIDPYRLSVYIGSGVGGFQSIFRECNKMADDPSGQWVSPGFIPTMIGNMAGAQVAIKFGARGSCLDIATACATSAHTLGEACRIIRHGYADAVIAGGTEACTIPIGIAAFANCRALTRAENPKYASLPFNANRGGFVMGDGAAVLILEEYEHARARGARIYAELVGYGTTCDAFHATAPRPEAETQAECISMALREASFDSECDKVYVNAHGTGTLMNDVAETKACKIAFGDYVRKCRISSTKSMHSHMLGATGAAEAIASVMALNEGVIPPTINLDAPDPECDLDYTPNKAVKADITLAVSNSFGFGGHNACLAFRKL
ncbi:MAG: beta-ketoacyl-ACP synthase II [Bacteroidales bacterium]|nr:beta-ketoacyl-ACP synthase II [Bacteroidales bacterium]